MSELTHEQADGVRDAIAIVRVLHRHGTNQSDAARADLDAIVDRAGYEEASMIIGVLAAMAAERWEPGELDEVALNALRMRP